MPENSCMVRIVLTTAANLEEGRRLGRALVEEQLAACSTLIPAVESAYRWKGNVESSSEAMLLLKTGVDKLAALETRLHQLHSYELPEFLVIHVEGGSQAYLEWLLGSVRRGEMVQPPTASGPEK